MNWKREKNNNNTHWVNKKKYACCAPPDPKISNNWCESLHIGLTSKLQNYNTKKCRGSKVNMETQKFK